MEQTGVQDKSGCFLAGCWLLADPQYSLPLGILPIAAHWAVSASSPCLPCAQGRSSVSRRAGLLDWPYSSKIQAGCHFMLSLHKRALVHSGWDLVS